MNGSGYCFLQLTPKSKTAQATAHNQKPSCTSDTTSHYTWPLSIKSLYKIIEEGNYLPLPINVRFRNKKSISKQDFGEYLNNITDNEKHSKIFQKYFEYNKQKQSIQLIEMPGE